MGRRAHCEVFKEAQRCASFFFRRPFPAFPPEGRSRKLTNTSAVNNSPLLRGVRRGGIALPLWRGVGGVLYLSPLERSWRCLKKMLKHERLLQSRVVYFSEPFCEQAPIRFTQISIPHKFGSHA